MTTPGADSASSASGMSRRFGWLFYVLGLHRTLRQMRLDGASAEHVRLAHDAGPVVYVLRRRSTLDHLALNSVLNAWRLPLSVWASEASTFFFHGPGPVWGALWAGLRRRFSRVAVEDPVASGWLAATVLRGDAVTFWVEEDGEPVLSAITTPGDRPVQFLPVAVIWDRAPKDDNPLRRMLRGAEPPPGFLREVFRVWTGRRGGLVRIGEPLSFASVTQRFPDHPVRAARSVLHRLVRREVAVVRGTELVPWGTLRHLVVDNPPMRDLARREAATEGVAVDVIVHRMRRDFAAIAADFRWWTIAVAARVLGPVWTRVFSGVDIRTEDLDAIRAAMRRGTVVLVPCHKSHMDYLLLSWVFYENDIMLPHIVAGDNLALWPISAFMRRCGAFFIRRKFSDDRVYSAVFARYVREIVRNGVPIEFFIEGGRSRTGRLLQPRFGVLGTVMDAAELRKDPAHTEVTLLPLAFAYEEVAEEATYERELSGVRKEPESFGSLLRARSVLERRFGRAYLRTGKPLYISDVVDKRGGQPDWGNRTAQSRRDAIRFVGEQLVWRIGEAMVVTASGLAALALLAHHRRGVRHTELVARCHRLHSWLQRRGAASSSALSTFDEAIRLAVDRLVRAGTIEATGTADDRVWSVRPDRRVRADFAKNQLLHHFSDAGLVAAALRRHSGPVTTAALVNDFVWLRTVLVTELVADPSVSDEQAVRRALADLGAHGAVISSVGDAWVVQDRERVGEIWSLVRGLLEGLRLPLILAQRYVESGRDADRFARELQADGETLLAAGHVTRPEALVAPVVANLTKAWGKVGVLPGRDSAAAPGTEERIAEALTRLSPMVA